MIGNWNGHVISTAWDGASATNPMQKQLVEGMNDVEGELQCPSSELDNNINDDGGYAAALAARVELQQVACDRQQDNKAKESSKKTMTMVVHRCTANESTRKQRRGRGVVSHCQLQLGEGKAG